jgi:hypothetical protein
MLFCTSGAFCVTETADYSVGYPGWEKGTLVAGITTPQTSGCLIVNDYNSSTGKETVSIIPG